MYEPTHTAPNQHRKNTKLSDVIDKAMSENIVSVEKSFDLDLELSLSEIKITDKIEPPETAFKIGNSTVSTLGNILSIIGKAKSRKSFLIALLIAIAIGKDFFWGLITSHLPKDKSVVLLFDTEQSKYHVQLGLKRICDMIQCKEPKNIIVHGLRKYPPAERLQLIEYAIYNTPNLGIVFIDGIKDLITSINDEEQATMIVSKLMKWSEELNISIVTVLHQNKSDTNARGHIGTELMNKSESVISVTKSVSDADISVVSAEACRNIDFEDFAFEINEFGIPIEAENFEIRTETKQNKFNVLDLKDYQKFQLLTEAFSKNSELGFKALENQIQLAYRSQFKKEIGINAVGKLITDCKNNEWIIQEAKLKPYTIGKFNNSSALTDF